MESTDDQSLLDAARAGDRAALETLLLRHQEQVYRFGMKLCRHPEDAEDILQDTLLAMANSIGDFQGRSSLSTWLYSVARSFCIKKRRKSKFAPSREESLESASSEVRALSDSSDNPNEALTSKRLEGALAAAIESLDPEQGEVLLLRDVEGLKAKEVAEILDISIAAVKSRLHRARLRLREQMAPLLDDEETSPSSASCPDVLTAYSKHLEDEISPDLCAKMEEHLETCPHCRGACNSLKSTLALCQSTPTQQVPKQVQESVKTALRQFLGKP